MATYLALPTDNSTVNNNQTARASRSYHPYGYRELLFHRHMMGMPTSPHRFYSSNPWVPRPINSWDHLPPFSFGKSHFSYFTCIPLSPANGTKCLISEQHRRRPWIPLHPENYYRSRHSGHNEPKESEWSRMLWSMAKTGFVPLRRKNIETLKKLEFENEVDTTNDGEKESVQSNLGGVAQARRPNWTDLSVGNETEAETRKLNRIRKPTQRVPIDGEEVQHIKKKQSTGIPWFLNLVGPPGNLILIIRLKNISIWRIKGHQETTEEMDFRGRWDHLVFKEFKAFKAFTVLLGSKEFKAHRECKDRKVHLVSQEFKVLNCYTLI